LPTSRVCIFMASESYCFGAIKVVVGPNYITNLSLLATTAFPAS
jgi:hypothetical protein